jgi:threonine aldolase
MTDAIIDLRSDTVTAPTEPMRRAMARAEVGDDVYGEDPTVRALEERVAATFGKEAALFTPTGSMANLLAVRALVAPGQEVLCESQAHIARAELGAHGAFFGVTMRTWTGDGGGIDLPAIEAMFAPDVSPFFVATKAVSVENTHNFGGGRVLPLTDLRALRSFADRQHVGVHIDGARIWNAHVASGVPLADYGRACEVLTVCLSKGLGAPVGSLVLGPREMVAEARVWRKRLGGGMRQVGVLAAAGIIALEKMTRRLAEDHENARMLARGLASIPGVKIDSERVQTNIVIFDISDTGTTTVELSTRLKEKGVLANGINAREMRMVTHKDVSSRDCLTALEIIKEAIS